jgi:hypothetical protein
VVPVQVDELDLHPDECGLSATAVVVVTSVVGGSVAGRSVGVGSPEMVTCTLPYPRSDRLTMRV